MRPESDSRPQLAAGCRLNEKDRQPRVLHMPERVLRLNGPSLEIIDRCDGRHTVRAIVSELQALYSKADRAKVESDILGYLELLHNERALDFQPAMTDGADAEK
ncbi:MAG: pyrroloquinoline quinone biosynthesis peptide chaperone PqqD [Acidobacteriota bacterium]|nr:pyrroloquinoline quinone biosynthesis peptide chaperone PqqD [Acidobacteriota bacterium]